MKSLSQMSPEESRLLRWIREDGIAFNTQFLFYYNAIGDFKLDDSEQQILNEWFSDGMIVREDWIVKLTE